MVFLNFWATWCEPCEEEMPGMERLYQNYKDQGLVVLAVSVDCRRRERASRPFVKKHGLTFPIGLDPKMAVASVVRRVGVALHLHHRPQGQARPLRAMGPREWDGQAARELFESLLK